MVLSKARKMKMSDSKIYDIVNVSNHPLVISRCSDQPIETRMDDARMCQVFTFWKEIQDILESGANEIRTLRQRIAELENDRHRKTDTSQST
jgi:DNA-binding IscR family transcriptional regulator